MLLLCLLAGACEHDKPPKPASSAPTASIRTQSSAVASTTPSRHPLLLPDGCYNGVKLRDRKPAELTKELAARCAPATDTLLEKSIRLTNDSTTVYETTFELKDASHCLQIVAAGTGDDLAIEVTSDSGRLLAKDSLKAPFVVLGPLCAREPGNLTLAVSSNQGAGDVALQVRQAR